MATVPIVVTAIDEALTALNAILSLIGSISGQGGMTTAQILSAAQAMTQANNTLYANLVANLPKT